MLSWNLSDLYTSGLNWCVSFFLSPSPRWPVDEPHWSLRWNEMFQNFIISFSSLSHDFSFSLAIGESVLESKAEFEGAHSSTWSSGRLSTSDSGSHIKAHVRSQSIGMEGSGLRTYSYRSSQGMSSGREPEYLERTYDFRWSVEWFFPDKFPRFDGSPRGLKVKISCSGKRCLL